MLLLDEPLAALDAQLRHSMLAELQRLKEALPDTAMLYVTHDQAEALALADRIVVMNNARLMDVDTAENLRKRAEAPQPGVLCLDWAPESKALLCIRPHALKIVSTGDRDAVRATVNAAVWRGANTRLVLSVSGLPDQLVDVDVPGHAQFDIGSEVGLHFPDPAGVLVQAAASQEPSS